MYTLLWDKCHSDAICVIKNCRIYNSEYTESRQCAIDFWNSFREIHKTGIESSPVDESLLGKVRGECGDSVGCLNNQCKYSTDNWVDNYVCFNSIIKEIEKDTESISQTEVDPSILDIIESECATDSTFCVREICEENIDDSVLQMLACFRKGEEMMASVKQEGSSECKARITADISSGYEGEETVITVYIPQPFKDRVVKVLTDNPACINCEFKYFDQGVFLSTQIIQGKGPFSISFRALDADGNVICTGTSPEITALGPRPSPPSE